MERSLGCLVCVILGLQIRCRKFLISISVGGMMFSDGTERSFVRLEHLVRIRHAVTYAFFEALCFV